MQAVIGAVAAITLVAFGAPVERSAVIAQDAITASISANVLAMSWTCCGGMPSCRAICVNEKIPMIVFSLPGAA